MDAVQLLDIRFESRDLGEELSIREYMRRLLSELFAEGEGFSGKRPFGNSGWEYEIIEALIRAGAVTGSLDSEGCVDDYNEDEYQIALAKMIAFL
jgi:hypothetical protein